jgi:hypothetical protein
LIVQFLTEKYEEIFDKKKTEENEELPKVKEEMGCNVMNILEEGFTSLVTPINFIIKEYSTKEKRVFVKKLEKMEFKSGESCYDAIRGGLLEQLISFLPRKYFKEEDNDMVISVLKKFVYFSDLLFSGDFIKNKQIESISILSKLGGYEILFHCFNLYLEFTHKLYIALIFCYFYKWNVFPQKYVVILVMLRETIRSKLKVNKSNLDEEELRFCFNSLIKVSLTNKNKEYFFTLNIIPLIYIAVEKTVGRSRRLVLRLLANICYIPSMKQKKELCDSCIPILLNIWDKLSLSNSEDEDSLENAIICLQNLSFSSILDHFFTSNIDVMVNSGIFFKVVHISEKKKKKNVYLILFWRK